MASIRTSMNFAGLAVIAALTADSAQALRTKPARDGDIAIAEEFCAARKLRSREAYDMFIARHPDHPLARVAREERRTLKPPVPAPRL